jgi:hypothetical protein
MCPYREDDLDLYGCRLCDECLDDELYDEEYEEEE